MIVGVAMALDFWVLGQAFGQVFTGMATDPDTGPLLVLLALAVYRAGAPAAVPAQNASARAERACLHAPERLAGLVT